MLAALMLAAIGPSAHTEHCPIASAIANDSAYISADNIVRSLVALRPLQILRLVEIPRSFEPDRPDQPCGDKIGIVEISSRHNGAGQIGATEQRAGQRCTSEVGLHQRSKFEVGAREVRTVRV